MLKRYKDVLVLFCVEVLDRVKGMEMFIPGVQMHMTGSSQGETIENMFSMFVLQ